MPIFSNADLKMITDSYHGEGYKQGRQDEREQCCKDICYGCRERIPIAPAALGDTLYHKNKQVSMPCGAYQIRNRAARKQEG
jgi:hypothetical protein